MKKTFFIAMLLLSVTFAEAQLNFGIKAGYNSSLSLIISVLFKVETTI